MTKICSGKSNMFKAGKALDEHKPMSERDKRFLAYLHLRACLASPISTTCIDVVYSDLVVTGSDVSNTPGKLNKEGKTSASRCVPLSGEAN
jgi:hypothetical protein